MWLGGLPLSSLQHPVASLFLGITNLSQFTQNSPGVTPENSVCWETLNPGDPPFGKGKVGFEVVFFGGGNGVLDLLYFTKKLARTWVSQTKSGIHDMGERRPRWHLPGAAVLGTGCGDRRP
jgi:hypothetical protein